MSDAAPAVRRVILLHGIWMVGVTNALVRGATAQQGFAPEILDYRSIDADRIRLRSQATCRAASAACCALRLGSDGAMCVAQPASSG